MDDANEDADTDRTQTTSHRNKTTRSRLWHATQHYRLLMEHPPRAGFKYELLMDEGSGLGMIPRGTTVLVTEGHISLTAVIRIWSWSPIYIQYSWWAKTLRDGHGNRVRDGRASGIRGMTSPPAIHGCTWFLGTRLTPPFRSYTLHVTWTIDLVLVSLWTCLLGLRASSWSACYTGGMRLGLHTRSYGRLPLDCWKINPVTMFHTADSFLNLTWTGWWTMKLEGDDHSVEFQP